MSGKSSKNRARRSIAQKQQLKTQEAVTIMRLYKEQLYKSLVHILPRGRKFLKYPKLKKKLHKAENVELISEYFKCSNSDALDYLSLGLLDQSDVDNIKISFGGRQK